MFMKCNVNTSLLCNVSCMMCSFEAADLDDIFKVNIKKSQYEKPTPVQKWAIPAILRGRDIMGCAQTGSGKTVSSYSVSLHRLRDRLPNHLDDHIVGFVKWTFASTFNGLISFVKNSQAERESNIKEVNEHC